MKSYAIGMVVCFMSAFALSAEAGLFEDKVDSVELAEAMAHCPNSSAKLIKVKGSYIKKVEGRAENRSNGVDVKSIFITSAVGGLFMGPPAFSVARLDITTTITQAPIGAMDAPATVVHNCRFQAFKN